MSRAEKALGLGLMSALSITFILLSLFAFGLIITIEVFISVTFSVVTFFVCLGLFMGCEG